MLHNHKHKSLIYIIIKFVALIEKYSSIFWELYTNDLLEGFSLTLKVIRAT